MSKKRPQYSSDYKFKLALEAAKGTQTLAEISSDAGVHPNQISQWESQLLAEGAGLFRRNPDKFCARAPPTGSRVVRAVPRSIPTCCAVWRSHKLVKFQ